MGCPSAFLPVQRFAFGRGLLRNFYGKIPERHRVITLDGDPMNCSLDNLYLVPDKFIPTLNKNGWLNRSREQTLAAIKWCEYFYAVRKFKEESL